jgi:hypothetical protein
MGVVAFRLVSIGLVALVALSVAPAQAQNSFQSLFGYSAPAARSHSYPALPTYRSTYGWSPYRRYQPYQGSDDVQPYERDGTVRTLCVRLCDGFYFPISGATSRSELSREADRCSAMCSAEARLFYQSSAGGSAETMVDLTGMAYTSLPNAFKYRKTLVQGCRCRPQPWSEAELQRHRAYEEGQAVVADARPASAAEAASASVADASPGFRSFDARPGEVAPIDRAELERLDSTALPSHMAGVDDAGVTVITNHRLVARPQPVARQIQVPPPSWYSGSSRWSTSPYGWPADGARRGR